MTWLKALAVVLPLCSALPLEVEETHSFEERAACSGNTATTRSKWCSYSVGTDYYNSWPSTGQTKTYNWVVEEKTLSPDGVSRVVQTINGQYPGPALTANWGDTVVINVKNNLPHNGTSIHWHGIRQLNTNSQDGVNSITQCPLAPGDSQTYTWQATQYGTSWYHSHYGLEAWDGVAGPIVINGPSTANYDTDLGPLVMSDWNHIPMHDLFPEAQKQQAPPRLDTGLINGLNTWNGKGSHWKTTVTKGKTYRLRLVNVAIDSTWLFSIDSHQLTVISADFVPIKPYTTNIISMGPGQRHDILFTADQTSAKSFWVRAYPDSFCSGVNTAQADNIRGILYYTGGSGTPSSSPQSGYSTSVNCVGEPDRKLVPYVSKQVAPSLSIDVETMDFIYNYTDNIQAWYLDGSTFYSEWNNPTALQVINAGGKVSHFNQSQNVVMQPNDYTWQYIVIQTINPIAHPIHLHGHDMFIVAKGGGSFLSTLLPTLNWFNPTRRDTEMLPALGWMVIAFQSDNPGAWLLHCHIGWHLTLGFSMQIVEQQSSMPGLYDAGKLKSTCANWNAFTKKTGLNQKAIYDDGV